MSDIRETIDKIETALAESRVDEGIFKSREEKIAALESRLEVLRLHRSKSNEIVKAVRDGITSENVDPKFVQQMKDLLNKTQREIKAQNNRPNLVPKIIGGLVTAGVVAAAFADSLFLRGGEPSPLETVASLLTVVYLIYAGKSKGADPKQVDARAIEKFNADLDFHIQNTEQALQTQKAKLKGAN